MTFWLSVFKWWMKRKCTAQTKYKIVRMPNENGAEPPLWENGRGLLLSSNSSLKIVFQVIPSLQWWDCYESIGSLCPELTFWSHCNSQELPNNFAFASSFGFNYVNWPPHDSLIASSLSPGSDYFFELFLSHGEL